MLAAIEKHINQRNLQIHKQIISYNKNYDNNYYNNGNKNQITPTALIQVKGTHVTYEQLSYRSIGSVTVVHLHSC